MKKKEERVPGPASSESILAGVPLALPGLTRAVKLQAKASTVGFDWNDARLVIEKIREETDEIEAALDAGDAAAIVEEIGDLLFSTAILRAMSKPIRKMPSAGPTPSSNGDSASSRGRWHATARRLATRYWRRWKSSGT